jgi:hypothetical protein
MEKLEIIKTKDWYKMCKGFILECPKCRNTQIDSYPDETLSLWCPKCKFVSSYFQDFIFNPSRRNRK